MTADLTARIVNSLTMAILLTSARSAINKLMEELATIALTEFNIETRFRARAARGSAAEGLRLLDKLDAVAKVLGS